MMDLDTLARRHAERARESLANAVPPPIPPATAVGSGVGRIPGPAWAVLAAIVVLVGVGVPVYLVNNDLPVYNQEDQSPLIPPEAEDQVPSTPPGESGAFFPTTRLHSPCVLCEAILLADGRALVLNSKPEIYDPETGAFTPIRTPDAMSHVTSAVASGDGGALVTDGVAQWLLHPATGSVQQVGELPVWEMARLGDSDVLFLADSNAGGSNETFLFNWQNGAITQGPPTIHSYSWGDESVPLLDGRVLLLGTTHSEIFDPISQSFSDGADKLDREGFTATPLDDGRVLIAGGQEGSPPYGPVTVAELFDPETGEFAETGELKWGRVWHAAALLPDGRVLIVGGGKDLTTVADRGELYDPSTGEFEPLPFDMTRQRLGPAAVTLHDGTVLIVGHYPGNGGFGSSAGSSTGELFTLGSHGGEDIEVGPENPTEHTLDASLDLETIPPGESVSTALTARLVVPSDALQDAIEVHALVTLDIASETSTGAITVDVGPPFGQVMSYDLSAGSGGTAGGGEVDLAAACGPDCDMTIPITISWTGDGPPDGVLRLRLQIGYPGVSPDAVEELRLSMHLP